MREIETPNGQDFMPVQEVVGYLNSYSGTRFKLRFSSLSGTEDPESREKSTRIFIMCWITTNDNAARLSKVGNTLCVCVCAGGFFFLIVWALVNSSGRGIKYCEDSKE